MVNSSIIPPEIVIRIAILIVHPRDFLNFTLVCDAFGSFRHHSECWFEIYKTRFPIWSQGIDFSDETDQNGRSRWREIFIRETLLHRRLNYFRTNSPHRRLKINFDEAKLILDDNGWRKGSPVFSIDPKSKTTLVASVEDRTVPGTAGLDFRFIIFAGSDFSSRIAIVERDFWTGQEDDRVWSHPFERSALPVVQLINLIHSIDLQTNEIRAIFVLAFGKNAGGPETVLLDVWRLVKVVEIFVCGNGKLRLGRVETIQSSTDDDFRGRLSRIYPVEDKEGNIVTECIALFGIEKSNRSRGISLCKTVFSGEPNVVRRTFCNGVSCMSLFPEFCGVDRFLVLINRFGRGMIWDWVRGIQVCQLRLPGDDAGSAPAGNITTSCWGVQVSFTRASSEDFDPDKCQTRTSFRIVTLADGSQNNFRISWWDIRSSTLGALDRDLNHLLFIPRLDAKPHRPEGSPPIVYAIKERFESQIVGGESASEEKAQQITAFVVRNQYFVCLTDSNGIMIMDLEESDSGKDKAEEWISNFPKIGDEESSSNLDILTESKLGLVIVRKDGYLIWPFDL